MGAKTQTLSFFTLVKLSGAGNTFLLADLRDASQRAQWREKMNSLSRRQLAKHFCLKNKSVAADGFIFLDPHPKLDFKWDFYNADGSPAEFCGNAARCAAHYFFTNCKNQTRLKFKSAVGAVEVKKLKSGLYQVAMPKVSKIKLRSFVDTTDTDLLFDFINTGVPHAVVRLPALMLHSNTVQTKTFHRHLEVIVKKIRSLKEFASAGTNVTFYSQPNSKKFRNRNSIKSLTYERGVSGYTQACGTGAVAAALCFISSQKQRISEVEVRVPGGTLKVQSKNNHPTLIGPATILKKVTI